MEATPMGTITILEDTRVAPMALMGLTTIQVPTPTGTKTLGLEVEVDVLCAVSCTAFPATPRLWSFMNLRGLAWCCWILS